MTSISATRAQILSSLVEAREGLAFARLDYWQALLHEEDETSRQAVASKLQLIRQAVELVRHWEVRASQWGIPTA